MAQPSLLQITLPLKLQSFPGLISVNDAGGRHVAAQAYEGELTLDVFSALATKIAASAELSGKDKAREEMVGDLLGNRKRG